MLGVYAQELQALKAELHHTLARLGDGSNSTSAPASAPTASAGSLPFFATPGVRHAPASQQQQQSARPASANSWSVPSTQTITTAANSPDIPGSTGEHQQLQQRTTAGTTWDARHLMHELRTASQRRRELEIELANEMLREQEQQQRQREARIPWQDAIEALQRQRAEIIRQIELESQRDPFGGDGGMDSERSISSEGGTKENLQPSRVLYRDSATQMSPAPPIPRVRSTGRQQHAAIAAAGVASGTDNHYSIEGVVTLEPLQRTSAQSAHRTTATAASHSQHRPQQQTATTSTSTSTAFSSHQQPPQQQQLFKQHELFGRPESHHDALNEVFSIQLKFAETMLKLEKSVQIRDQLLQRNAGLRSRRGVARMPARRTSTAATASHDHRYHHEAVQSDSESYCEDDLVSSDYDSFSSGASLGDYAMRLRRYTSDHDAEIHATASVIREVAAAAAAPPSANTAANALRPNSFNLSAVEEENHGEAGTGAGDASSSASPDSQEARTPSTENSDKTSNNSSSTTKQVRFGDGGGGEYSTPVIARKFNFDNQSDDENDDVDRESILSFMDGSSVTSTELNDVSLIKAFEAFRRELGNLKAATPQWQQKKKKVLSSSASSGITAAISAARALFANDDSDAEDGKRALLKPAVAMNKVLQDDEDGVANPAQQGPVVVANATLKQRQYQEKVPHTELGRAALSERRRQLCLDIQAESAQLVLTFGSRNAHETERVKQHLLELRCELRTVDEQLQKL